MSNILDSLLRFVGFTIKGWMFGVLPVYIVLWICESASFAKTYTIELTLLGALGYGFVQLASSVNAVASMSVGEYRQRIHDRRNAVIFASIGMATVITYTGVGVYQRHEAEAQRQIARAQLASEQAERKNAERWRLATSPKPVPAKTDPLDSFCMDVGQKYGRAAFRAMRGQDVSAADDVEIPVECRNRPSTKMGIERGGRMEAGR